MKSKNLLPALVISAVPWFPRPRWPKSRRTSAGSASTSVAASTRTIRSAYAGIDYAADGGFYLGTWGADVGDGLETDVYFGFAGGDNFTYKIGYTGYFYTDDFDDTYQEVNLGIGYGHVRARRRGRRVGRLRHAGRLHVYVDHDLSGEGSVLQVRQLRRRLRRRLLRARLRLQHRRHTASTSRSPRSASDDLTVSDSLDDDRRDPASGRSRSASRRRSGSTDLKS